MTSVVLMASSVVGRAWQAWSQGAGQLVSIGHSDINRAFRHDDDQRGLTGMASVASVCQSAGLNMALRGCGLKWNSDTSIWHDKAWFQNMALRGCGLKWHTRHV